MINHIPHKTTAVITYSCPNLSQSLLVPLVSEETPGPIGVSPAQGSFCVCAQPMRDDVTL